MSMWNSWRVIRYFRKPDGGPSTPLVQLKVQYYNNDYLLNCNVSMFIDIVMFPFLSSYDIWAGEIPISKSHSSRCLFLLLFPQLHMGHLLFFLNSFEEKPPSVSKCLNYAINYNNNSLNLLPFPRVSLPHIHIFLLFFWLFFFAVPQGCSTKNCE